MNVVGYGGGTDSTAMLIGLWKNHIPVDLILFADPGGEQPHTYAYLEIMDRWLKEHDMPPITRVWYQEKSGQRLTLEQECLRSGTLPSIAYGRKSCSLKHKVGPHRSGFATNTSPAWIHGQEEKRWSNLLGMMPERNAADRGR
jgi:3'-phosphoadenosine 5'-phosphosulfate sulfotransferase (PAPS reductase)/FAD synthetase